MNHILEANLPDLILDLHAQYGTTAPRPSGSLIQFTVVHDKTTYRQARAAIEALLARHGVAPIRLQVDPGPEVASKFNRRVQFCVAKQQVI